MEVCVIRGSYWKTLFSKVVVVNRSSARTVAVCTVAPHKYRRTFCAFVATNIEAH